MNYLVMEGFKVRPRSRAAMNKLVMNYLVTEGFKVMPRVCHDASVQGCHE
jgi:hypothetical protein